MTSMSILTISIRMDLSMMYMIKQLHVFKMEYIELPENSNESLQFMLGQFMLLKPVKSG